MSAPAVTREEAPVSAPAAALLAGATGKLLFGALSFALAAPMLRRLRAAPARVSQSEHESHHR